MATSAPDTQAVDRILAAAEPIRPDSLIPILQAIQEAYGYLRRDILLEISRRTGIPASRMYGVATFYEQFHLEPRGRHTVKCCRGTACHVKGGADIRRTIEKTLNLSDGETTEDMSFTFETVACLGTCFLAPVMMVDHDYYGGMTSKRVGAILQRYK